MSDQPSSGAAAAAPPPAAASRKEEGVEGYKTDLARDPDAFPEPKWPSRTIEELIEVTFRGITIETHDHPALLRLIGARQNLS